MIFPVRNINEKIWTKFKKFCLDEIDPETGKSISANAKLKQMIENFVKEKESEGNKGNKKRKR
jgi:hypothetical protein